MYWSFLPSWAKEKRLKFSTFNARDDRLLESKVYKSAVPNQRCIIPATYFFEPDKKHFPKPPHPWYCFRLTDQKIFGLAGLYNIWTDPKTSDLGCPVFRFGMPEDFLLRPPFLPAILASSRVHVCAFPCT